MKLNEASSILRNEMECIENKYDKDCNECFATRNVDDVVLALKIAIHCIELVPELMSMLDNRRK